MQPLRKRGKPKLPEGQKRERVFFYIAPNVSRPFDECCRMIGKSPSDALEKFMRTYTASHLNKEAAGKYIEVLNEQIKEADQLSSDLRDLRLDIKEKYVVVKDA